MPAGMLHGRLQGQGIGAYMRGSIYKNDFKRFWKMIFKNTFHSIMQTMYIPLPLLQEQFFLFLILAHGN
jgi:hypothetical protein